jgi:hypothetical protein
VWRDHLDAVSTQLLIQRIAIVGAITDQILRLGFEDAMEEEAANDLMADTQVVTNSALWMLAASSRVSL